MRKLYTVAVLTMLCATAPATAQAVSPFQLDLRPVDQRVAGVGLLSNDLRIIESGLDVPTSFEQVYQLPGSTDQLVRIQGGISAVYPKSQAHFSQTPFGVVPDFAPGTVFHIGPPPVEAGPQKISLQGEFMRWNTRIENTRVTAQSILEPHPASEIAGDEEDAFEAAPGRTVEPPAMQRDAAYRRQRIRELLEAARDAEVEAASQP